MTFARAQWPGGKRKPRGVTGDISRADGGQELSSPVTGAVGETGELRVAKRDRKRWCPAAAIHAARTTRDWTKADLGQHEEPPACTGMKQLIRAGRLMSALM